MLWKCIETAEIQDLSAENNTYQGYHCGDGIKDMMEQEKAQQINPKTTQKTSSRTQRARNKMDKRFNKKKSTYSFK